MAPVFLMGVPVTPDPDTARQWADEELARPIYHQSASWVDRVVDKVLDFLDRIMSSSGDGGPPPVGYAIGVVILAIVIILGVKYMAPALTARRRSSPEGLLEDDERTAAVIAASADAAARAGRWAEATLERYRALVRSCEERLIIDDRPGRTAREAARDIADAVGGLVGELLEASETFDAVCYGHRDAVEADHAEIATVAVRVATSRASVST